MLRRIFTLIVLLSAVGIQAAAQTNWPPVLVVNEGRLAYWYPESGSYEIVLPETTVTSLTLNPQGTTIAMEVLPALVTDALARVGFIGGGKLPNELFVWEIDAQKATPVAVQPVDAAFFTENVEDDASIFSEPVWSPEGTELAYSLYGYPGGEVTLWIFDLLSGESRQLPTVIPLQMAVPGPVELLWGKAGLIFESIEALEGPALLHLVDPQTGVIINSILQDGDLTQNYGRVWVDDFGREWLGFLMQDGSWRLLDVLTGEVRTPETRPEMISTLAGTRESLRLVAKPYEAENGFNFSIYTLDFTRAWDFFGGTFPLDSAEISPDGTAVLYRNNQTIEQVTPQNSYAVPAFVSILYPFAITWSPVSWILPEPGLDSFSLASTERAACPDAMLTRLYGASRVTNPTTTGNNIRAEASTRAEIYGSLPAGTVARVLDGPVCAEGLVWWYVNVEDILGYVAEGSDGEYFLEAFD